MTTPNQLPGPGESLQQNGSGWNQDVTEESVKDWARDQVLPGFGDAFLGQLDLWAGFESLGDLLAQIANSITKGQIPAPGPLLDIFDKMDGVDDGILDLKATLNQIRDVFNGLIVTPINNVVTGIKDWFNNLLGWQTTTTNKQKDLANGVWSGATQQEPEYDKTPQEVLDAVSDLKSRTDDARAEMELRYQSSVPLWQGLVPGGDVTCPIGNIGVNSSVYNSPESVTHFYPCNISYDRMSFAAFRARSSVERNYITFLAGNAEALSGFRVSLWTYRYDEDLWEMVSVSDDISSEAPSNGSPPSWVDAQITPEYNPEVGELMAVAWFNDSGSVDIGCERYIVDDTFEGTLPKYHSVPHGTRIDVDDQVRVPSPGIKFQLRGSNGWITGATPYAQISPDLGQGYVPPKRYWFDAFNYDTGAAYGGDGLITNGAFRFIGTTDGTQSLTLRNPMSTDRMAVEATLSALNTSASSMHIHSTVSGQAYVEVRITRTSVTIYRSDNNENIAVATGTPGHTGYARWKVEFDSGTYTVYQDYSPILTWNDTAGEYSRGKGRRSAGLSVSRSSFVNSPAWDDFLVYDLD